MVLKLFLVDSNVTAVKKHFAVVDGGYLLHKVIWPRNASFATIAKSYSTFLKRHYGSSVVVVFDGYPVHSGTKRSERMRRMKMHRSPEVIFDVNMINQVAQENFLANDQNKSLLIEVLKTHFEECDIEVQQAQEDADLLIVNTAISKAKEHENVVIVGEDIDLLVLMTGFGLSCSNLFFLKPGRGSAGDVYYSTRSFKFDPSSILFIHTFIGCDTTSSIFGQGKIKLSSIINKSPGMKEITQTFLNPLSSPDEIAVAGEKVLSALYTGDIHPDQSLDTLRFTLFAKSVSKRKVDLARLPPTCDAARYHSYRCFHQIQTWLGNTISPEEWGWASSKEGLVPVHTMKDVAPESLLKSVACACKKGCSGACSCRKAGLKCSTMCKHCSGQECENSVPISSLADDEEGEELFQQLMEAPEPPEQDDTTYLPPPPEPEEEPGPSKRLRRR